MWIVPWDPVLKLNLHFFQVASPMNNAHGPTKKKCNRWETHKTHFPNSRFISHLVYVWIALKRKKTCALRFFFGFRALFMGPASTDFNKFFFKTGSHSTILTFKNYFVIVFSVFSNKQYSNKSLVQKSKEDKQYDDLGKLMK